MFTPLSLLRSVTMVLCLGLGCAQATEAPSRVEQRIPISPVWPGHPVNFALLTDAAGNRQYAAYYDADRNLVVASRHLDSSNWETKILPTRIGWDSHNYVVMALDREGQLHVSGNMHVNPLRYFRTSTAGEIASLEQVDSMVGDREKRVTYPQFIKAGNDELIFIYRDGSSGRGDTLYNRYDEKTRAWTRLLDQPLFDGKGKMNAYPIGPVRGPDGWWHMTWVWRNTPAAETNHDLGYARSKDLINWETIAGNPLAIPITIESTGAIVDPIPVEGGIINGSGKIGFDLKNRVVITYHKFDENGLTQLYNARFEDDAWNIHLLTRWQHRWDFRGGGSGPTSANNVRISHSEVRNSPDLGLYLAINHSHHGNGNWRVNDESLQLGEQLAPDQVPGYIPPEIHRKLSGDPRMRVMTIGDTGTPPSGLRYLLRWETLPVNRDRPQEGELPPAGTLELVAIKTRP